MMIWTGALLACMALIGVRAAIEPAHLEPVKSAPKPDQPDPIGGFILPSFGIKVSYRPAAEEKKPEPKQPIPAKPPTIKTTTLPVTVVPTTTTSATTTDKKDEEQRKKREEEDRKKKEHEEKKKREQQQEKEKEKKREQEEQQKRKKEQEEKKKQEEERKKKASDQKPNELKNKPKNKTPPSTRYEVPKGAGIGGVGGGALPDPGFVLEPRDLFQQAENAGRRTSMASGLGTISFLLTLVLLY